MKCRELLKVLEQRMPLFMACDWDNSGLLIGSGEKEVRTLFLALDATDEVVEQAVERKADLLLTHHPLIFRPLKTVTTDNFIANRVIRMIQNDLSCMAMHTNYDSAPGCMADLAAERLGMTETSVLQQEGEVDGVPYGIGRVGRVTGREGAETEGTETEGAETEAEGLTLKELSARVKHQFQLPSVNVFGDTESDRRLTRIAVCPGSGGSTIGDALRLGAQVLVTGDIGHHDGIDAVARGLCVIDAGHYGLEHIFMEDMERYLKEQLGDSVNILREAEKLPCRVL